jgi:uncharacterized membrane protein HdeD (DUF308 family)
MFMLSYIWHGVVLNDLIKLTYPTDIFLTISALVYLGIGFIITVVTYVMKRLKDSFKYGMAAGALIGIFIYAVAFVMGLSFNDVVDIKIIAFDLGWQVLEQGFGGLMCGWVYRTLHIREKRVQLA